MTEIATPVPAQNVSEMHQRGLERPCLNCGGLYAPKRRWQRFCNIFCQRAYNRGKATPEARITALERRVADLEQRLKAVEGIVVP